MTDTPRTKREAIFQACDELLADGEKVTNSAVLEMVGGSNSTVVRYIQEWKKVEPFRHNLSHIPTTLLVELDDWFGTVVDHSQKEISDIRKGLEEKYQLLSEDLIAREAALRKSEEQRGELENRCHEFETALRAAQDDLAAAVESNKGLNTLVDQLRHELEAEKTASKGRLKDEQVRGQQELDRVEAMYKASESRMAEMLDRERQTLKQERQERRGESEKLLSQIEQLQDRIQEVTADRAELKGQLGAVTEKARLAEEGRVKADSDRMESREALARVQGQTEALERDYEARGEKIDSLLSEIAKAKTRKPRATKKSPPAK